MPIQRRITDLPQVPDSQGQRVFTRVTAQPRDTFMPAGTNEHLQLAEALRGVNPALNRYFEAQQIEDQKNKDTAINEGRAAGSQILDPMKIINQEPAIPQTVTPALKKSFLEGYREAIGNNLAGQSRDELLRQYNTQKDSPDFNLEGFLQDYTTKEFQGINDPQIKAILGQHHQQTVASIRGNYRDLQFKRLDEDAKAKLAGSMDNFITEGMEPEQIYAGYHQWLPQAIASGKYSRGEAAQLLMNKLQAISMKANGRPELFDILDNKDESGLSISNANPALVPHIESLRKQAETQRESYIQENGLVDRSETVAQFYDDLKNGKAQEWTDDRLKSHIGKHGIFNSDREYQSARAARDKAIDDLAGKASILDTIRNGNGWSLSKEDQKFGFDSLTASPINQIVQSLDSSDPNSKAATGAAIRQIIGLHTLAGTPTPNTQLKNLFESVKNSIPGKDGQVSQRFQSLAQIYEIMKSSNNPSLIDLYTDEDSRKVLEMYSKGRQQGIDPNSAFVQAYQSISPEAKARAQEIAKQPDFVNKVNKTVEGVVTSNTPGLLPNFLRFKWMGYYPDESGLQASAKMEAARFLTSNQQATVDDVQEHLKKWVSNTRVYVPSTNTIVEVPNGEGGTQAQEAINDYLQGISKERGKDSRPDLIYKGNGKYQVMDHATSHVLATEVSLDDIRKGYYAKMHITGNDASTLVNIRKGLRDKTLTLDDLNNNRELVQKATKIGAISVEDALQIEQMRSSAASGLRSSLHFNTNNKPDYSKLGALPSMTNPSDLAKRFLDEGNPFGALTAMGEGIVYKASPDPAKGAGQNIGLGYNLQANDKNLVEDFRKAGIPNDPDSIKAIKEGRMSINDDQVMRLYKAVQPRYEARAKSTLEAKYPGEWDKLSVHQKAALTDLAYQVKDPSQFGDSMEALVNGKATDGNSFKVHFRNSKGELVEDTRRNNLRLAMLRGPNEFNAVVKYVKGIPTVMKQAFNDNNN